MAIDIEKAITYNSPIVAGFDGGLIRAVDVVDDAKGKLQSVINEELEAKISTASGNTYSKADIDSKVSTAQTNATTASKSYTDQKISALGSVYRTKGSITSANLKALASAAVGDVYNVTDAVTINKVQYPAGVNVVCVTAFSAAIDPASTANWDALQGVQDLSGYVTTSWLNEAGAMSGPIEVQNEDTATSVVKKLVYGKGYPTSPETSTITIAAATSSKAGVMSATDKTKLDGLSKLTAGTGITIGSDGKINATTNTFSDGVAVSPSQTGTDFKFNLKYDAAYMKVDASNQLTLDLTKLKASAALGIDDINAALKIDGGDIATLKGGVEDLKTRVTALEGYLTLA